MKTDENLNKKCGSRLKKALKLRDIKQKEFASITNFTDQYISDMCRGVKPIGYENAYNFAKILNIRQEYLLCIDNYMTEEDMKKEKKDAFFNKIGNMVSNSEKTISGINRFERISKLFELRNELEDIYELNINWDDLPFGSSLEFYSFIDEQLEHSFRIYFKYFDKTSEHEDTELSDAIDGFGIVMKESIDSIKKLYPEGTTQKQFYQSLKSEDKVKEIENEIKNVIRKEGE